MISKKQFPLRAKGDLFSSLFSDFPMFLEQYENGVPSQHSNVSISEDDASVFVEVHMPGLNEDEIEVSLDQGVLWVKGERTEEEGDKTRKYYYKSDRKYSYRIAIPGDVDFSVDPNAEYAKGILHITFAKSTKAQPKRITVQKTS